MDSFSDECRVVKQYYWQEHKISFTMYPDGYFGSFVRGDGTMSYPPSCAFDKDKGKGRECLLKLCEIADRHKIMLRLYATKEKCVQLYKDCGFEIVRMDYDRWIMERLCR